MDEIVFHNDNNTIVKLSGGSFDYELTTRPNKEQYFRKIHTYLILNGVIKNNIIDLGAWIGDNSLVWAKMVKDTIYSIDPSPCNIEYIKKTMEYNDITNIKTIQKAVGDKMEYLSTNSNLTHCSFDEGTQGKTVLESTTLDILHDRGEIENIGYIHLDVEGFEYKVIRGSKNIIKKYRPIITIEEHINHEDYIGLTKFIHQKGYNVYLINEVLPGCHSDCRNFLAIPLEVDLIINYEALNSYVGECCLVSMFKHNNNPGESLFTATLFGDWFSFHNIEIRSVRIEDDRHVFATHSENYTKMVEVNEEGVWVGARYLLGLINLNDAETVKYAYMSSKNNCLNIKSYNIKNLEKNDWKNLPIDHDNITYIMIIHLRELSSVTSWFF